MAYDVKKLLDIAMNEVGYLEKETYDQLDEKTANAGDENYTKYQRDLAKISYFNGSKKGIAWCAVFVAWCFVQAFGKSAALKLLCQPSSGNCGAGCNSQMNYYKNKKRFYTDAPQVGDQILFWSSDKTEASHTGIVYKVDNTYVYTIEGNTSSSSGVVANGGAVATKKYKLSYDRIAGYGRPDYGVATSNDNVEEVTGNNKDDVAVDKVMQKGDRGEDVKVLQRRLQELGYYTAIIDGDYGFETKAAIKSFQKNNGLAETGVADITTQNKLHADGAIDSKGKLDVKVEMVPVTSTGIINKTAFVSDTKGVGASYRQAPDSSAPYVAGATYIPHGEQVNVKTSDGTWAAVEYKGYRGYVMVEFLKYEKQENAQQKDSEASDTEIEVAWIHGATGKGASYRRNPSILSLSVSGMSHIPNGEQVYIKSSNKSWAKVEYKEYSGYVKTQYLTKIKDEEVVEQEQDTTEPEHEVVARRTYTTVQGDTLWGISKKFYGVGYEYKKIMSANGMKNTIVRPGMELIIPE